MLQDIVYFLEAKTNIFQGKSEKEFAQTTFLSLFVEYKLHNVRSYFMVIVVLRSAISLFIPDSWYEQN